jgi:polyhydroxyalkanoate synthesis regulator phasin
MPGANDLFRRLLDSGVAFTQMTQERAEAIVRDLVRAGEVQSEQTTRFVQEILDQSRQNTERLLETIRNEVREQVAALGLADRDDIQSLRDAVNRLRSRTASATASTTRKASGAKKTATKKASGAKKTATKKASGAKKTGTKKASGARKTAARKTTGARKTTAKRASGTTKKASGSTKRTAKKATSSSS